jgi:hypothetical protein
MRTQSYIRTIFEGSPFVEDLGSLLNSISKLHSDCSLTYVEPTSTAVGQFVSSAPEVQLKVLTWLNLHQRILLAVREKEISFRDNRSVLKVALDILRLKVEQDFLDTIAQDDLLEIYSVEMIQIFRNFRFFTICGYSLLELELFPWHDLYERSHLITEKLMEVGIRAIENQVQTEAMTIPSHYMKERFSQTKQVVKIEFKHMSPLKDYLGQRAGFAVSQHANIIVSDDNGGKLSFI